MKVYDVAIIGAGPSGLAVASRLSKSTLNILILERTATPGQVWANHYEGLTLNTVASLSRLAGRPFPAAAGMWPRKEDVAQYLADLAHSVKANVQTKVEVEQLKFESAHKHWVIHTTDSRYHAKKVVLATGINHEPLLPAWASTPHVQVPIFHSSQYRSPVPFAGQKVLVVGGGNSGAEIACRVAQVADRVVLSLREAPLVLPKQIGPLGFTYLGLGLRHIPAALRTQILRGIQRLHLGDHQKFGLPLPTYQYLMNGGKEKAPTFYPEFLSNVRTGKVQIRGGVTALNKNTVHLKCQIHHEPEEQIKVDSIICATGFSPKTKIEIHRDAQIVSEHVLKEVQAGNLNPLPQFYALGFVSPISGQFREIDKQSKKIVANIKRQLENPIQ